jgi:uncharacterized protein
MEVRKPTEEEAQEATTWPVWEKGVSEFDWEYRDKETCYIIEGAATVTAEDGKSISFKTGDWVIFEPSLKCTWKIKQPIKKHYSLG